MQTVFGTLSRKPLYQTSKTRVPLTWTNAWPAPFSWRERMMWRVAVRARARKSRNIGCPTDDISSARFRRTRGASVWILCFLIDRRLFLSPSTSSCSQTWCLPWSLSQRVVLALHSCWIGGRCLGLDMDNFFSLLF